MLIALIINLSLPRFSKGIKALIFNLLYDIIHRKRSQTRNHRSRH